MPPPRSHASSACPSPSLPNWPQAVCLKPSPMSRRPPTGSQGGCRPPLTSTTTCIPKPSKPSPPPVFWIPPPCRLSTPPSAAFSTPSLFPPLTPTRKDHHGSSHAPRRYVDA